MLYEGLLYFDIETGALARAEFNYTQTGTKRGSPAYDRERAPYHTKPSLPSCRTWLNILLCRGNGTSCRPNHPWKLKSLIGRNGRKQTFTVLLKCCYIGGEREILLHFSRKEIFRPGEFFTEKNTSLR
jgi:hypothetical protein